MNLPRACTWVTTCLRTSGFYDVIRGKMLAQGIDAVTRTAPEVSLWQRFHRFREGAKRNLEIFRDSWTTAWTLPWLLSSSSILFAISSRTCQRKPWINHLYKSEGNLTEPPPQVLIWTWAGWEPIQEVLDSHPDRMWLLSMKTVSIYRLNNQIDRII